MADINLLKRVYFKSSATAASNGVQIKQIGIHRKLVEMAVNTDSHSRAMAITINTRETITFRISSSHIIPRPMP